MDDLIVLVDKLTELALALGGVVAALYGVRQRQNARKALASCGEAEAERDVIAKVLRRTTAVSVSDVEAALDEASQEAKAKGLTRFLDRNRLREQLGQLLPGPPEPGATEEPPSR